MILSEFHTNIKNDDEMVKLIADKIEEGALDPKVRKLAFEIVRKAGCPSKDWYCEIRAIYDYVKKNIRYFYDIRGIDTYHSARAILFELKGGDCDDFSIVLGSLLAAIGYPIKLRIIAKTKQGRYIHIYPLVGVPPHGKVEKWIPLELTDPRIPFGKEFPHAKHRDYLVVFEPERFPEIMRKIREMDAKEG
jgi:hypothetical protein